MKTIDIVKEILDKYPETKDNDKMLCYRVWERIAKENGEMVWMPFNLFKILPAFETISRTRRNLTEEKEKILVNDGYIPTKSMSAVTYPTSWMMS